MLRIAERNFLEKLLLAVCVLTTMAITPKTTADPINPIKMAIIAIFGFAGIGLILPNIRKLFSNGYKWVFLSTSLFVLTLATGVVTSGQNFNQEFFGVYGRNTGFVTYFSLSLLMIVASVVSSREFITRFLYIFVVVGLITTIYGYLQYIGIDPAGWTSPYSPILGFLGNPDFNAAFLGMSVIAAGGLIFRKSLSIKMKLVFLSYIFLTLFLMKLSVVKQGFFVVAVGLGVFGIFRLYFSRYRKLAYLSAAVGSILTTVVLLALFNLGPLANLLYKSSLTARGYYWQAGLKMISENPLLGVGLDNFGNWYLKYRSQEAYNWAAGQNTNSAHNVFIDIGANAGLIAFISFILINIFALYTALLVIKRSREFDPLFVTVLSIWVGFNAQLLISINQIGVSIWGWITTGLIIGYNVFQVNFDSKDLELKTSALHKKIASRSSNDMKLLPGSLVLVSVGFFVGACIGLPAYIGEARYFTEMSSGDPIRIQKAAYIWPKNQQHFMQVGATLRDNKSNTAIARPELKPETIPDYSHLGIQVARDAIKYFPDSIYTYQLLRSFTGITTQEDVLTKEKMRELDPFAYGK